MDSPDKKDGIVLFGKFFKGLFLVFDILSIFDAPVDRLSEHGIIQCAV